MFRCGSPDHAKRVWRGFPIRTSWDHRSVINSPRLIADSYVLLRLLMPRHPPCALKNLTTQDQKTSRENQTPERAGFIKRNCCKTHTPHHPTRGNDHARARCSRPLCSSQTTTPYHTPPAPPPPPPTKGKDNREHTKKCSQETRNTQTRPEPRNPHRPRTPRRPCCLRTQQCAKHENRTTPHPHRSTTPHHKNDRTSVLNAGKKPPGRYLLIFHP
ncbi:hypothetical protein AHiyo1_52080 [Arthrobacter sp. Hiyo1]|nr:hypothetical protein AHiyo1_52080 [Arthrobacter sp. Hiyo1]